MKFSILIYLVIFTGCSIKEYKLFQDENPEHTMNIQNAQDLNISYKAKIIPDDILLISLYNMGEPIQENKEYLVDEEGTVILPLIQEVTVKGLTLKELNNLLKKKYKKYLTSPKIKSKIKNHKIFVLGEIGQQGVLPIQSNSVSIIEVISKLGGLTDHALKNRIRIISENHGKYQMRTLDLTKIATLNTNNLMVKYNSIVYIEPKTSKAIKVAIEDYSPIMQAISTVLSAFLTIDYLKR